MGDAGAGEDDAVPGPTMAAAKRVVTHEEKVAKKLRKHGLTDGSFVVGVKYQLEQPSNHYRELKYAPGAQAKNWRDQGWMAPTSTLLDPNSETTGDQAKVRKKMKPALFGSGVALSLVPLDSYLVPPTDAGEEDDDEPPPRLPHEQLELQVRVRLARRSLNYCTGLELNGLTDVHMTNLNAAISACFNGMSHTTTRKELTKDEVICWVYHELPLVGNTGILYWDSMSGYQKITKDVLDLLDSESLNYTSTLLDAQLFEMVAGLRKVVLGGIGPVIKNDKNEWGVPRPLLALRLLPRAQPPRAPPRAPPHPTPRPLRPLPPPRVQWSGTARSFCCRA